MNAGPYLILHRVRGEPAFDIAERTIIAGEEAWIVATSGHRAYPWHHWLLEDLQDTSISINNLGNLECRHDRPSDYAYRTTLPSEWPDHYTQHTARKERLNQTLRAFTDKEIEDILATLGVDK